MVSVTVPLVWFFAVLVVDPPPAFNAAGVHDASVETVLPPLSGGDVSFAHATLGFGAAADAGIANGAISAALAATASTAALNECFIFLEPPPGNRNMAMTLVPPRAGPHPTLAE
jgi:hypothetical protein